MSSSTDLNCALVESALRLLDINECPSLAILTTSILKHIVMSTNKQATSHMFSSHLNVSKPSLQGVS